jgi:hypothetical protein
MILGMTYFTLFHVLLSLVGILSGFVALYGLLTNRPMKRTTLWFLATTVATSFTGFGFPYHGFTPGIGIGILSLIILAAVITARYAYHLTGAWRGIYVAGAVVALYFNVFVLVVQSFQKIPSLHALAPKGSEPLFAATQAVVLIFFIVVGILSIRRFRPVSV